MEQVRGQRPQPARKPGRLAPIVLFVSVLGGLVSTLGLVGGYSWVFDLCNHFQAQYWGVQCLCLMGFLAIRRFRWALVPALFLCLPTVKLAPYYLPSPTQAGQASQATPNLPLRVLSFNVLSSNSRCAETLAWVRQTNPDVAFFPEITPAWESALEPLKATMPHAIVHPREDNFGFALFSKFPISNLDYVTGRFVDLIMVEATLEIDGRELLVVGVHPLPPVNPAYAVERDTSFQTLAESLRAETRPVVVMGDFNATTWSHAITPLLHAGLSDTMLGHGFSATWNRLNPIIAIPIDLILVNRKITTKSRSTGPDLGSDHRPIVADLLW